MTFTRASAVLAIVAAVVVAWIIVARAPVRVATDAPASPALTTAPIPGLLSVANVRLDVPHAALGEAIDAFLPRSFSGSEDDPIAAATEDSLDWSLSLGDARLSNADGALGFRIPIENGRVTLRGRIGVARRNKGALGLLERIAGFDFSETLEFEGRIDGTIRPRLDANWTIDPGLQARVNLSKAEIELFGRALRISFRDAIRTRIDADVDERLSELRRKLAADGRLVSAVERVWNAMHAVVPLSDAPPVWLSTRPVALAAGVPVSHDDGVGVTIGATVEASIAVGSRQPVLEVRPLVAPIAPSEDGRFVLRVPVSMRLDTLANVSPATIGLPASIELRDGSIHIDMVSISSSVGDELTVAADVRLVSRWKGDLSATLYVSGTPLLDREANRLSLDHARYDIDTRSALLGIADVLLEPAILAAIERRAVFDILESEQELLSRARAELELIEASLAPWADASIAIDSGQLTSVVADGGWLVAILEVTGSAELRLVDATALLK